MSTVKKLDTAAIDAVPGVDQTGADSGVDGIASTEETRPGAVYKDPLKIQHQLRNVFFVLFMIGLGGALKHVWEIPALSVIVYFLIGMMVVGKIKNIEGFADSLYYMGFLFTLWSLFIAFAPIEWLNPTKIESSKVMASFSVALITTVLGITGRIFILQGRQTIVDLEEDARESLTWLVKRLTTELETSVTVLQAARNEIINAARENNKQSHELLNLTTDEAVSKIKTSLDAHLATINQAVTDIADKMGNVEMPDDFISQRYEGLAQQMETNLSRVTAATNKVVAEFESIKQPISIVEQRLQETGNVINESLSSAGKSTRELANRMEEVSISRDLVLAPITEATNKLVASIDEWRNTVDQMNSTLPSPTLVALLTRGKNWTREKYTNASKYVTEKISDTFKSK
ncbi:MAG: hypothetical protein OEZ39_06215 [Gammaproteobacteria bacterium]|nr:hypothetical protein [Gammaproteobacteria bacterium]MDH5651450.1 hypothetical protein [Gammaproteobacteria bacterium]